MILSSSSSWLIINNRRCIDSSVCHTLAKLCDNCKLGYPRLNLLWQNLSSHWSRYFRSPPSLSASLHLSLSVSTSILLTHRTLTHPMFQGKRAYFNSMAKVKKRRNASSTTTTACMALYWMRRPTLVSLLSGEITTSLKRLHFNIFYFAGLHLFCFERVALAGDDCFSFLFVLLKRGTWELMIIKQHLYSSFVVTMILKSCTPLLCQWLIEWLCRQLTWMDLLGCRRREKREERTEDREERKRKTISSVVPSLSHYPPHISHTRTKQEKVSRQYECSKDLHDDIKRGRRGEENENYNDRRGCKDSEEIREEERRWKRRWHTLKTICISISACASGNKSLALCIAHLLALKEEKKKMKRGERRIIKQKTKNYKTI